MKIRRHAPDVHVLKTAEPEEMRRFFEGLGLTFQDEKHGDGVARVACERNGHVREIHPETVHGTDAPRGSA